MQVRVEGIAHMDLIKLATPTSPFTFAHVMAPPTTCPTWPLEGERRGLFAASPPG